METVHEWKDIWRDGGSITAARGAQVRVTVADKFKEAVHDLAPAQARELAAALLRAAAIADGCEDQDLAQK